MKLGDTELEKNNEKVACSALSGEPPSEEETQAEAEKTQRNQPCVKRMQNIRMEGAAQHVQSASGWEELREFLGTTRPV